MTASLPFLVRAVPTLSVSAALVAPGEYVTVSVTDGLGAAGDWLALASTSAPNTTYLAWTYVGTGVTSRTWTVRMPTAPGTYEFRYFTGYYTRVATSATVMVVSAQ